MSAGAIKAVHACRRRVAGLDDDEVWREFLHQVVGKRSLREMDGRELGRVIDALHARGAPKAAAPKRAGRRALAGGEIAAKARALWLALYHLGEVRDPSEAALDAFVTRQTGIASLRWLPANEAWTVIEALRSWCGRAGFEPPDTRGDGGLRAKVLLVEALWRRLGDAGALRIPGRWALDGWVTRRYLKHAGAVNHLSARQLDDAAERLGAWLREHRAKQADGPA